MNTDTGKIISPEEVDKIVGQPPVEYIPKGNPILERWLKWRERKLKKQHIIEMKIPPTPQQCVRGFVALNDFCPCGSQKKFKKCCYTGPKNETTA